MKKIKKTVYNDGSEAFVDGNIDIAVSGLKKRTEEDIELTDEDAKKIINYPAFFRLSNGKAVLKDVKDVPEKLKIQFKEIKEGV